MTGYTWRRVVMMCYRSYHLIFQPLVYMPACGRTCDMGHLERRERERKATARNILGWYTVNCLMSHSAWPVRSSSKNIEIRVSL